MFRRSFRCFFLLCFSSFSIFLSLFGEPWLTYFRITCEHSRKPCSNLRRERFANAFIHIVVVKKFDMAVFCLATNRMRLLMILLWIINLKGKPIFEHGRQINDINQLWSITFSMGFVCFIFILYFFSCTIFIRLILITSVYIFGRITKAIYDKW